MQFFAVRSLAVGASVALAFLLSGCTGLSPTAAPSIYSAAQLGGHVHGGQQPISGGHIYLMAASTAGYGSSATSLLTKGDGDNSTRDKAEPLGYYVNSGSDGSFTLPATSYTCTSGQMLYFLATGGNPGLEGDPNNAAIALVSPLGLCQNVSPSTNIQINEATTIAMAYAFSGFMSSPTQFASSGTTAAVRGIANAYTTFGNLVSNTTTGTNVAYAIPPGNTTKGVAPQQTINLLANILAACVNTNSSTSGGCNTLLDTATSDGTVSGTVAPDTYTAAYNIARNPYANVHALYQSVTTTGPFQTPLSTEPADLTVRLIFGGVDYAFNTWLSVDGTGNIYGIYGGLGETSPAGAKISPSGGYASNLAKNYSCVINPVNGNIEVSGTGSIEVYSTTGTRTATYTGALTGTSTSNTALAIDSNGNSWAGDWQTSEIGGYTSSGTPINNTPYTVSEVQGLAFDSSNTLWATESTNVDQYTNLANSPTTTISATSPLNIAFDSSDNVWFTEPSSAKVVQALKSNSYSTPTSFTGHGIYYPQYIAVDGAGTAWVTGTGKPSSGVALTGITSSGTIVAPAAGYLLPNPSVANTYAVLDVDLSGNVWVSYNYDNQGELVQFVGLGTPVYRPLTPGKAGTRP